MVTKTMSTHTERRRVSLWDVDDGDDDAAKHYVLQLLSHLMV